MDTGLTAEARVRAVAGDTVRLRVTVRDEAGLPVSLVGMTARAAMDDGAGAVVARTADGTMSVAVLDANNGLLEITIPASVTGRLAGPSDRVFRWELRLVDLSGRVGTPIRGTLRLLTPIA
jgi:hypothetical protein